MRSLLYVPIIHTESDMGSAASTIDAESASLYGKARWAKHKETVVQFWASLANYLEAIDVSRVKIYQDGLPAGGGIGKKIVEEAARRGSANYRIILHLMERGAEVRKTEDASLLGEEYRIMTGNLSVSDKLKNHLTAERDKFIAKTIGDTLKEGETGLLFVGSAHDVLRYLPGDITVRQVKERDKVNAYFQELQSGASPKRLGQLAAYLIAPCVV